MEVDILQLKNKKVFLAPFNNLTQNLEKELKKEGICVLGFLDSFKSGHNIFTSIVSFDYDYIIINSPNYWKQISVKLDLKKVILAHTDDFKYISYYNYTHKLKDNEYVKNKYDVLFLAYNKSNVTDCSLVSRKLLEMNISSAIIDISNNYYQNIKEGFYENPDIETIKYDILDFVKFKVLVCSIDWEDSIGRPLIDFCHKKSIPTIGLVDGIEDFEDSDYKKQRNAYQTVEYVLVTGKNDLKFLKNKLDKCFIVGLPKMYHLYNEPISSPSIELVVINVNFTYGTFEEVREMWLEQVVKACKKLNLKYIIAQHHADHGDLTKYNVSRENIYDTIRKGSIVISRFSTVISEALALGKKVIYHNPHREKVKLYKEAFGAFSISHSLDDLIDKIEYELSINGNQRNRANRFLDRQFNINAKIEPALMAAKRIKEITKL